MSTERQTRRLSAAYRLAVVVVRPLMLLMTKRDWGGTENLPDEGGFVVAPNHVSHFDPFATAHFLYDNAHPPYFLGKESVFRIPVAGRILHGAGQIPVYRRTGRALDAYRAAVAAVQVGKAVVVFPEGTITRDPDLWPMASRSGAARIALETGCPLIPVAQWGAQEVLAPYGNRIRLLPRKTMHVLAGAPVDLSDLYDRPTDAVTVQLATDRVLARITALLEQLRGETAPTERFDSRKHGLPEFGNPRHRRKEVS